MTLLDEAGHAVGIARKGDVHHQATPLHLAFSCYVFDGNGSLLLVPAAYWPASLTSAWDIGD